MGRFLQKGVLATSVSAVLLCGTVPVLTGCDRLIEAVALIAGEECVRLIRQLFDQPNNTLPSGFHPCGTSEWTRKGVTTKFCYYCDDNDETEIFVQQDCEGKYYPMRLRRLDEHATAVDARGVTITQHECLERLALGSIVTCDPLFARGAGQFIFPDGRTLPRIAGYKDLSITIDGNPVKGANDFPIAGGSVIDIEGSIDEVAHYAMIIGIEELTFTDESDTWEIFTNREASALMAFKNDTFVETRFLFAPNE